MCMGAGETVALVAMIIFIATPTVISELREFVSDYQNKRIEKLEEEIKELKKK